MALWMVLGIRLGVVVLMGVAWALTTRLTRAVCRDPEQRLWVQLLIFVAVCCVPVGVLLATFGTTAAENRPAGLIFLAVGLGCAAGAWALSGRHARPPAPGTEESFTPQEPEAVARGADERTLVAGSAMFSRDAINSTVGQVILTDRTLRLGSLAIPRGLVRSITYSAKRDRITIEFQDEKGPQTIWLGGQQLTLGRRRMTPTYRLFNALQVGFLESRRLLQPIELKTIPGWRVAAAVSIGAVLLLVALGPTAAHGTTLQRAADTYQAAPLCSAQPATIGCRKTYLGTLVSAGAGRHPDGKAGAATWLAVQLRGETIYADSPAQVSTSAFHVGELVALEQYGGKITRAATRSIPLDTYDSPSWTASNFWIFFDLLAALAGIMSLLSAWLWIRFLRRPDPRQTLTYPDAMPTAEERAS